MYCEGRCSGGAVELSGPWDLHIPALNQALLGAFGCFSKFPTNLGRRRKEAAGFGFASRKGQGAAVPGSVGTPQIVVLLLSAWAGGSRRCPRIPKSSAERGDVV